MAGSAPSPFSLPSGRTLPSRLALRGFERASGLRRLDELYRTIPADCHGPAFLHRVLRTLGVEVAVTAEDLGRIPRQGPLVVVANHPHGGIEGVALGHALASVRGDVRILANYVLARIPQLRDLVFSVDPFPRPGASRRSVAGLREALHWVRSGGALVTFPAGEVSHLDVRGWRVIDPPWAPMVARLVGRTQASAVPVFFPGRNGALFQLLGLIHPYLRTVLLPRELLARRGTTLEMRVGRPVPAARLSRLADDRAMVAHLRDRVYMLGRRDAGTSRRRPQGRAPALRPGEPVAGGPKAEELAAEIAQLPDDSLLTSSGDQQVFVATSDRIPRLLQEIGRLRERTFRSVGEGTGRACDLDRFDHVYRHLFIWDRAASEVVGAYRLGLSDEILGSGGVEGLYTSTLFAYRPSLFRAMGPALEMGRSWIRPRYQRSYASLLLLWKGIGSFVVRHPRYAVLFGPVSISADYQSASQQLIVAFLQENDYAHPWSRWVRPRFPFRPRGCRGAPGLPRLTSLDEVSSFIADLEADERGVPILLRQYLRLGGRLLGFNVDPEFSNVLDVLIAVDLRHTEARTLERYMGPDGAAGFLAHHSRLERLA